MDYTTTIIEIKKLVKDYSSKEISEKLKIKISEFYNICKRENILYKKTKGNRLQCPDKKQRVRRKKMVNVLGGSVTTQRVIEEEQEIKNVTTQRVIEEEQEIKNVTTQRVIEEEQEIKNVSRFDDFKKNILKSLEV
jgi:predicted DNA-binding protein YlxM (UPF0122 family)